MRYINRHFTYFYLLTGCLNICKVITERQLLLHKNVECQMSLDGDAKDADENFTVVSAN